MRARYFLLAALAHGAAMAAPFASIDDIAAAISRGQVGSLEQVLETLSPELRSHFTLLYRSKSAQHASLESPRAILFGRDARFLVAFNEALSSLEVTQYREAERRFDYYEVTSRGKGKLEISARNPARCLSCHQSDPRPNWDFYDRWSGAFGSNDDVPDTDESAALDRFFSRASLGPYSILLRAKGSAAAPYETTRKGRLRFRPNLRLMVAAFARNTERLTRLVQARPEYPRLRYLLMMSRLRCSFGDLDPAVELDRMYGQGQSRRPLGQAKQVTVETLYAYLLRGAGFNDSDWTMSFDEGDEAHGGWGPYAYFFGAATFGKKAFLQADLVVARLAEQLATEWSALKGFVRPTKAARERFSHDAEDWPAADALDAVLRMIDFTRLREACPSLLERYRLVLAGGAT